MRFYVIKETKVKGVKKPLREMVGVFSEFEHAYIIAERVKTEEPDCKVQLFGEKQLLEALDM